RTRHMPCSAVESEWAFSATHAVVTALLATLPASSNSRIVRRAERRALGSECRRRAVSEPSEEQQAAGAEGALEAKAKGLVAQSEMQEPAIAQAISMPAVLPPEAPPPEPGLATPPAGPTTPLAWPTTPLPERVPSAYDAPTLSNLPSVASPIQGLPAPTWGPRHNQRSTPAAPKHSAATALARRFSVWLSAFVAVGAFAAVGVVYSGAELLGRSDWADGASLAGGVAFALAGAALM